MKYIYSLNILLQKFHNQRREALCLSFLAILLEISNILEEEYQPPALINRCRSAVTAIPGQSFLIEESRVQPVLGNVVKVIIEIY